MKISTDTALCALLIVVLVLYAHSAFAQARVRCYQAGNQWICEQIGSGTGVRCYMAGNQFVCQ